MEPNVVRFAQSARKYQIGKAHVLHVLEHCEPTIVLAPKMKDSQLLWIGMDDRGVELEVVAVKMEKYLLVIHVMPHAFRRN